MEKIHKVGKSTDRTKVVGSAEVAITSGGKSKGLRALGDG